MSPRRPDGARPPARRRARRALQHGGHGPAPGRAAPTACRSCTARSAARCSPTCGPTCPAEEAPIGSVTNGVHARHVGVGRDERPARPATSCPTGARPPADEWERLGRRRATTSCGGCSEQGRERLVGFVRERLQAVGHARAACRASDAGLVRRGARPARRSPSASPAASPPTSGPPCCCRSPSGCARCCCRPTGRCSSCSPARPTRPTTTGKEMIRQIVAFAADPERAPPLRVPRRLRHRGRPHAVPGRRRVAEHTRADRRRRAARRGMKAALNGALNCSILDGWWDELFDGENGWAISSAELDRGPRAPRRDRGRQPLRPARAPDRAALLRPLGRPGAPALGARGSSARCASLGPEGGGDPHGPRLRRRAVRADRRATPTGSAPTTSRTARALAAWKARVAAGWHGVHIDRVDADTDADRPRHRPRRGRGDRPRRPGRRRRRRPTAARRVGRARRARGPRDHPHAPRRRPGRRPRAATRARSTAPAPAATASPCASSPRTPTSPARPSSAASPGPPDPPLRRLTPPANVLWEAPESGHFSG